MTFEERWKQLQARAPSLWDDSHKSIAQLGYVWGTFDARDEIVTAVHDAADKLRGVC